MCVTVAFSTSRAIRRGVCARGVIALHAGTTSIYVSRVYSSFRGFVGIPQTVEFPDVFRCDAASGFNGTCTDAVRSRHAAVATAPDKIIGAPFAVTAAYTEFDLSATASCTAVYGNSAWTQLIRGESASCPTTSRVPLHLPVLGSSADASAPRRWLFILE